MREQQDTREQQNVAKIYSSGRVIRCDLQDTTQHLFGDCVVAASRINLSEINRDPCALASGGERALIKYFLVGPIATAHNAASAQSSGND